MVEISKCFVQLPDNLTTNEGWRHVIEDHLQYLKQSSRIVEVEPELAHRFHQDIIAYLYYKQIPVHLHWIIMRLNGMTYPHQFTENIKYLVMPDERAVDELESGFTLTTTY